MVSLIKGNGRSFAQLHNPYTLQNLVEAMNQQNARGEGAWGLSANTLMSTATAEYQNLDEVRADKSRLQQIPEEEYKALLEQADGQIEEVISRIRQETAAHSDSGYVRGRYSVKSFCGPHRENRRRQPLERPLQKRGIPLARTRPR